MTNILSHYRIVIMVAIIILSPIILSVLSTQYESCKFLKFLKKDCVPQTFQPGDPADELPSSSPDKIEFTVSSQEGWQDTGIIIDKGDYISIKASGTIVLDSDGRKAGPDGEAELPDMEFCTYLICRKDIRAHALLGRIGVSSLSDYTSGFQVGSDFNMYTDKPGHLFLGFNDLFVKADRSGLDSGGVGDNSGEFNVVITIAKKT